jgi:hypothetical protein
LKKLDMSLGSGQQEQSEYVVGGEMNTGEGHQALRGGRGLHRTAGVGAPLISSQTGSSSSISATRPKALPDLQL